MHCELNLLFPENLNRIIAYFECSNFLFHSLLDFMVSVILFLSKLTTSDIYRVHNAGILGELECRLWNTQLFLWSFFFCSTWNLVSMTYERYGIPFVDK